MEIKRTGKIWYELYSHNHINKELYIDLDKEWVALDDVKKRINKLLNELGEIKEMDDIDILINENFKEVLK